MKILFLTTINIPFSKEHVFTRYVFEELNRQTKDICLGSIFLNSDEEESTILTSHVRDSIYYQLYVPKNWSEERVSCTVAEFFNKIGPSIIHSNSTDTFEIKVAKSLGIPIVLTIHVGGVICPRSKVNGFLKYNNTICNSPIGPGCLHCISKELPFSNFAYFFLKLIPSSAFRKMEKYFKGKNIYYLSRLIYLRSVYDKKKADLDLLGYAKLIAANTQLIKLLEINGLRDNVYLLPHGVKPRKRLPYPSVRSKIKFYYVGRLQYAKGLEVLINAFEGIDCNLYELHILGEAGKSSNAKRYFNHLKSLAQNKNITFHSPIPNEEMDEFLRDKHVMIHPTFCHEIYGIAIAESLSCGRPVIATRCGGAEMQVVDGDNGWLVQPNNVSSLRKKILQILENREVLTEFAQRCTLPHSLKNYATQLLNIYCCDKI